ncbi:MAG: PKD domain-containing protein [Bacteroidota bacterium]
MNRTVTLLLIVLCPLLALRAQSTTGTEFWLGYMENLNLAFNDQPAFAIIINANGPTNGSIEVPTTGLNVPFSVGAGTTEVFLPSAIYYSEDSEQIENIGIRISADAPISVQAIHYRLYFTESTSLLPTGELGTDYLVTTMLDEGGLQPSSLVIVATADNTEVEITPAALTLGLRPANTPFTITLDEGQLYQVQSTGELTGTRIRSASGQPIAVFGGAQQANINDGFCSGGADSHVWDQTLPVDDWRDLYYFVPFLGQGGDRIRILAGADNTRVFFDCALVATLDEGEFFESFLDQPTVISSTEAISLTQYNNGFSCEPSQLGDPNAISYLPADFRGNNFRWLSSDRLNTSAISGRHFDRHFVTIVASSDATDGVALDGVAVNSFTPFSGNPEWEYARLEISGGTHELIAAEAVQVYSYGFGFADAYTNHLGYTQTTPEAFACLEIEREGVLCADSLQQFTYTSNLDLVNFDWDFGDGNNSTLPEPTHIYSQPGTYEVILTASDANGLVLTANLIFTVVDCSDNPCSPDNVQLDLSVTGDGCALFLQTFTALTDFTPTLILWDFGDGNTASGDLEVQHFYETVGTYTVTVTMTNELGCVFTENILIDIQSCDPCQDDPALDLSIEGPLCSGESIAFNSSYLAAGIPILEIQWSFSDGQVAIEENPMVTFAAAGTYQVELFIFNAAGCFYQGFLEFTLESCDNPCADLPPLDIAGPLEACVGETYTYDPVTSANLVNYSWSTGSQSGNQAAFQVTFQNEGQTDLTLQAIDAEGCDYEVNIVVNVTECTEDCTNLPPLEIGGPISVCVDSFLVYTAESTANLVSFSWTFAGQTTTESTFPLIFDTPGIKLISLSALDVNGCEYTTQLQVLAEECEPDCSNFVFGGFEFIGDVCLRADFTITGAFNTTVATAVEWVVAETGEIVESPVITEEAFPEVGTYEINYQVLQLGTGCLIDTNLVVTIEDCPLDCSAFTIDDFFIEGRLCVDSLLTLDAVFSTPPDSFIVTLQSGELLLLDPVQVIFLVPGIQTITIEAFWDNGCTAERSIVVDILNCVPPEDCELMIPNAFSPNRDGVNDDFRAFFGDACTPESFTLEVYNRWGGQVYQSNDPNEGWNGRFRGREHPSGVLIYWCQATFPGGATIEKKGDITLIR